MPNEFEIARKLLEVYQTRKLPRYSEYFSKAGFTRELLEGDANSLFELLIVAAYDRQPFTWWASGWEPIWGISLAGESLPAVLRHSGLLRFDAVETLDLREVERRLKMARFYGRRLDSYGGTIFAKTLKQAAASTTLIHSLVVSATAPSEVLNIRRQIVRIHGFGPTIAAKIVMYTMRELGLGEVNPRDFAPVIRPLLDEYHNTQMAKEIDRALGSGSIDKVFDALCELGDPCAIDALYYIDRDEPGLKSMVFGQKGRRQPL